MTPEEQIDAITLEVCEQFAQDITDDIRDSLDNAYPPASQPGEKPHKRSGQLQEGIISTVIQQGPLTQVLIESKAPHSEYLESGTKSMRQRPYMEPAQDKWTPILVERLQEAFDRQPASVHGG